MTYCPPGFVDGEDGAKTIVKSSWRSDTSSGLGQISQIGSNRYVIGLSKLIFDLMKIMFTVTQKKLLILGTHLKNILIVKKGKYTGSILMFNEQVNHYTVNINETKQLLIQHSRIIINTIVFISVTN